MERVSENVWVETGYFGANLGIIKTSAGLFLVDTPMNPSDQGPFLREVSRLGSLAWVIVTDHHLDHFLGASFLPGMIIAHREVRGKFLPAFGPRSRIAERVSWSDPSGAQKLVDFQVKEPSLSFEDKLSFYLDPVEIHLETLPGHTPHTVAVRVEPDGVVFAGDNVVNETPPFFHDAKDPRIWIRSLEKMKNWAFQVLVPGHGPVAGREALGTMVQSIESVLAKVREGLNQGLAAEEMEEKVRYLSAFPSRVGNSAQRDFHRQLERKGIGRLIEALRNSDQK